jgi:hypothetical protein
VINLKPNINMLPKCCFASPASDHPAGRSNSILALLQL